MAGPQPEAAAPPPPLPTYDGPRERLREDVQKAVLDFFGPGVRYIPEREWGRVESAVLTTSPEAIVAALAKAAIENKEAGRTVHSLRRALAAECAAESFRGGAQGRRRSNEGKKEESDEEETFRNI